MINIDSRSSKPIYEQIIEKVKENIIKGILKPGDKLPSVRELAAAITVNPNTISKAYIELERMKTIQVIRGKGTFVSENFKPVMDEEKMKEIKEHMKKIIIEAHYIGLDKDTLIDILNDIYNEF
ncbi:GntR family transcriptional regulator [Clostridium estertheticum]|uniref:GntR family transcriptional regulator n=1 Tax=Clostridium estertheticum TaxID=238834 RepID=A0A5N7IK66_9CLOT|nr:GntR family transcriptional regulator [Clostridium estertheticum]MBW9171386.1 GntR family transcriptional regulator [Clostridium estertheticum]MBX4264633.1 GntR family transcriptional regulator [Clostridium estertheticum]MBX4268315.1 GntR family transcriptional regulator [Clostridium estertheticum]MPQ30694.1 GntR family transcriptional regulator [Clostridium estertheticum]MPQ61370.1 GntR family transcriptional regulator [Clostridium estertheticum]